MKREIKVSCALRNPYICSNYERSRRCFFPRYRVVVRPLEPRWLALEDRVSSSYPRSFFFCCYFCCYSMEESTRISFFQSTDSLNNIDWYFFFHSGGFLMNSGWFLCRHTRRQILKIITLVNCVRFEFELNHHRCWVHIGFRARLTSP